MLGGKRPNYIIGTQGRCTLIDGLIEGEKPWKFEGNNMTDAEQAALMDCATANRQRSSA